MRNEELFLDYRPLAYSMAYSWWSKNAHWCYHFMDREDCSSEALMALISAANSFEEERDKHFAGYASVAITHHFAKIWHRRKKDFILNEKSFFEDCADDISFVDVEFSVVFMDFFLTLSEKEQKILGLLQKEVNITDCAKVLKNSQPAISWHRKNLFRKYREFSQV